MSKVKPADEFASVPAFAAATPELQAAIVAAIGDAETVHLYPARGAYLEPWDRREQDVSRADSAHLLAHIPPFYPTKEAAAVSGLLTD